MFDAILNFGLKSHFNGSCLKPQQRVQSKFKQNSHTHQQFTKDLLQQVYSMHAGNVLDLSFV
jgi:hypothetical protein